MSKVPSNTCEICSCHWNHEQDLRLHTDPRCSVHGNVSAPSKTQSCTGGLGCCGAHSDCPHCGCSGRISRLAGELDDWQHQAALECAEKEHWRGTAHQQDDIIEELRAALRAYGRHRVMGDDPCQKYADSTRACTCGLEQLCASSVPETPAEAVDRVSDENMAASANWYAGETGQKPELTYIAVVEPWHDRMRIAGRIISMERVCEKLGAPYPLPPETRE